jgi:DNA-binding Lrp family transcriptional regulator
VGRPEKNVDIDALFDLVESGTLKKDIAETLDISPPTLSKRIAEIQKNQGLVMQYRALQNLQLTELQYKILEAVTPEKIEGASLAELAAAFRIFKNAEQVMIGKPSDIKGFVHYLVEMEKRELAAKTPVEIEEVEDLEEGGDGNWRTSEEALPDI